MKSFIITFCTLIPSLIFGNERYIKSMESNIQALYKAQAVEELQVVANKFERIASVEKEEWLPNYYTALAYAWMASREKDPTTKDRWLDNSDKWLEAARVQQSGNSEIVALQGFVFMMRVTVDPASRGQVYSQKAFTEFGRAISIDDQNPRALFFQGQMQYGTAQFFKMETTEACATLNRSLELFDKFKAKSSIHPNWGKAYAENSVTACNN